MYYIYVRRQHSARSQEALKDPEMLKTAMAAAGSGPEADMMKKMTENPQMTLTSC